MLKEDVKKVKIEMKRLKKAIAALEANDDYLSYGYYYGCKESGAVRRASMDLTRALSEMRKYK